MLEITLRTTDYAAMYCLGALQKFVKHKLRPTENLAFIVPVAWGPNEFVSRFCFATRTGLEVYLEKVGALLVPGTWERVAGPTAGAGP